MKKSVFCKKTEETIRKYKLELINQNLLLNYKKILNNEPIKNIINNQYKCVINMNLKCKYKNKHITIQVLEHYKNTKNKHTALNNLTNYLSNKKIY